MIEAEFVDFSGKNCVAILVVASGLESHTDLQSRHLNPFLRPLSTPHIIPVTPLNSRNPFIYTDKKGAFDH